MSPKRVNGYCSRLYVSINNKIMCLSSFSWKIIIENQHVRVLVGKQTIVRYNVSFLTSSYNVYLLLSSQFLNAIFNFLYIFSAYYSSSVVVKGQTWSDTLFMAKHVREDGCQLLSIVLSKWTSWPWMCDKLRLTLNYASSLEEFLPTSPTQVPPLPPHLVPMFGIVGILLAFTITGISEASWCYHS